MTRYISIAHRLTGWNAIKARAEQLNLDMHEADLKEATLHIKRLADEKTLTLDDVDVILRDWVSTHRDGGNRHG
jgi:homocitrate synthase